MTRVSQLKGKVQGYLPVLGKGVVMRGSELLLLHGGRKHVIMKVVFEEHVMFGDK